VNAIVDIDAAIYETESWIDELTRRLGWHDREHAYRALLATLHALRDSLPRDEAIYLAAQLPPLLRGLYYEGWHPSAHPAAKSRSAFLTRIHDGVRRDRGVDPEQVARAVFAMLSERLPPAEVEDARAATPSALHNLWPT
jgi:uncharacterized protein (DUF2267 family)